jgi:hypothetical protein
VISEPAEAAPAAGSGKRRRRLSAQADADAAAEDEHYTSSSSLTTTTDADSAVYSRETGDTFSSAGTNRMSDGDQGGNLVIGSTSFSGNILERIVEIFRTRPGAFLYVTQYLHSSILCLFAKLFLT